MRRGRPPKPANLRVLMGNAGHRPIKPEPKISRQTRPGRASWLPPDFPEALWGVVDELFAAGVVTSIDVWALAAFAEFCATFRTATETLAKLSVDDAGAGLVAKMASGSIVTHPVLAVKNRAQRDVLRAAAELGLSPAGRVGLQGVEPADERDVAVLQKYQLITEVGHA